MKFYPLASIETDGQALSSEYAGGRTVGKLRLGDTRLYFNVGRKVYYLPYTDLRRCFRRVQLVAAKLCCGKGNIEVENLVICGDEGELAQIQLPGARAGKAVMEELRQLAPHAEFGRPPADGAAS